MEIDYNRLHVRKLAIFQPRVTDNIRPEIVPYIGKTLVFECTDFGYEDEPYPGQYRWFALTDGESANAHEPYGKVHRDFHWWVPDEDLIDVAAG
jgi:hypothetical protein